MLEAEIRAAFRRMRLVGAGNLQVEMSGEGRWKAGAGVSDESGKGLSGGDSWEEKKR